MYVKKIETLLFQNVMDTLFIILTSNIDTHGINLSY